MSGEIGDVIGGDTIAAGFTNAVKDRTVMRYATAVERDTLIPAPVEGDMAYLQDIDELTMFRAGNWVEVVRRGQTGNINAVGADFITAAPGAFRGPAELVGGTIDNVAFTGATGTFGGQFTGTFAGAGAVRAIYVETASLSSSPGSTVGRSITYTGFTDLSKMVITILGAADNDLSRNTIWSFHELTITAFELRGYVLQESAGGTDFTWYRAQVVEYY